MSDEKPTKKRLRYDKSYVAVYAQQPAAMRALGYTARGLYLQLVTAAASDGTIPLLRETPRTCIARVIAANGGVDRLERARLYADADRLLQSGIVAVADGRLWLRDRRPWGGRDESGDPVETRETPEGHPRETRETPVRDPCETRETPARPTEPSTRNDSTPRSTNRAGNKEQGAASSKQGESEGGNAAAASAPAKVSPSEQPSGQPGRDPPREDPPPEDRWRTDEVLVRLSSESREILTSLLAGCLDVVRAKILAELRNASVAQVEIFAGKTLDEGVIQSPLPWTLRVLPTCTEPVKVGPGKARGKSTYGPSSLTPCSSDDDFRRSRARQQGLPETATEAEIDAAETAAFDRGDPFNLAGSAA